MASTRFPAANSTRPPPIYSETVSVGYDVPRESRIQTIRDSVQGVTWNGASIRVLTLHPGKFQR